MNAEEAELPAEQRRGCTSQFSVNSDDEVVEFQRDVYSIIYCDKTLLITLNCKQKLTTFRRHPIRCLRARFFVVVLFCFVLF